MKSSDGENKPAPDFFSLLNIFGYGKSQKKNRGNKDVNIVWHPTQFKAVRGKLTWAPELVRPAVMTCNLQDSQLALGGALQDPDLVFNMGDVLFLKSWVMAAYQGQNEERET